MSAESNEMPRALRREISVWKRLEHRNIHILCGLYEGIGPVPALVSPWYQNGDIKSYLQRHVDDTDVDLLKLRLLCDIMCGVKFLHGNSIVHGDIKGQNVLISDAGVATLCDFGLSRLLAEHSQSVTYTGVWGTSRWMAPEIFLDGERLSYASDMWACGCLFIEVWNNALPYQNKMNDHQISLALDGKELPGSQLDMPETIWTVVQECFNFDATQHPASLQVATNLCFQLVMHEVDSWVTLSRPMDAHVRDLLLAIEASLRTTVSHTVTELYPLSDSEVASDVIRHLSLARILNMQRPKLLERSVFRWCFAKFGVGDIILPSSVALPARDEVEFGPIGLHEPAALRPLARLVERARPGLAIDFMTYFSASSLSPPIKLNTKLRFVAWLSDGNRIAVACDDAMIRILDIATGAILLRLVGHNDDVRHVAVSPDERLLASCSDDRSIRLWDAQTGYTVGLPMVGHTGW
ncbi:kinase-like protein, partial [Exidia glandulosa HHB12029]